MATTAALLTVPSQAPAKEPITGRASVIDGDTIEIHGQRIRFFGVDAPESRQLCQDENGGQYRCGQRAALALSDFIGQATVRCAERDRDKWRRIVAVCRARGEDLSGWMAAQGLGPVADTEYSRDYVRRTEEAKGARRGIWRGAFEMPWEWRRKGKPS
ncbi:thermonuclease family protein [Inquilinus sp. YAF38]|uniref:thermonuclease family protein n=1 Tax=Inquilinus sp. YAF38 TaxID=3233084 RepID=UPI003F900EF8